MSSSATFLHLTDTHLRTDTSELKVDDIKTRIPGITHGTREQAAEHVLNMVAEQLKSTGQKLDGVLFSGDAQWAGQPGGHDQVLAAILRILADHGVRPGNIVATPGNHDVPRKSPPSSSARYDAFMKVWAAAGCIVPWLEGVHTNFDRARHFLEAEDKSWAIVPINSSNWCQVEAELPPELHAIWNRLPMLAEPDNEGARNKLAGQLEDLRIHDVPRISQPQLQALRTALRSDSSRPPQLRIAMMHHHLRAPTLREEFKTFESITDLELVRRFLREQNFVALIHGHKHETALTYEDVFRDGSDDPHRLAVVSGATFDHGKLNDVVRLVHLEGLPHRPSLRVEGLKLTPGGTDAEWMSPVSLKLWQEKPNPNAPVMVSGSDINEVYERVVEVASEHGAGEIVIVDLDLAADIRLPLPEGFFLTTDMTAESKLKWLEEIVEWWQLGLPMSDKQFPFPHGTRLRKFAGSFDQIERIIALLQEKPTSRAIATLIDPMRDFTTDGQGEAFASFCLVEFKLRDGKGGSRALDIIGFYRVQEFAQWWPVNVAELRELQIAVAEMIGNAVPGKITTITGEARVEKHVRAQVAVSVLDRWHDSTLTLFHVLATTLAGGEAENGLRLKAVDGWYQSLVELEKVASNPWASGAPVPKTGLALLGDYLNANGNPSPEFEELRRDVRTLRAVTAGHANAGKSVSDYRSWSTSVLELTKRLRKRSNTLLGNVAS